MIVWVVDLYTYKSKKRTRYTTFITSVPSGIQPTLADLLASFFQSEINYMIMILMCFFCCIACRARRKLGDLNMAFISYGFACLHQSLIQSLDCADHDNCSNTEYCVDNLCI